MACPSSSKSLAKALTRTCSATSKSPSTVLLQAHAHLQSSSWAGGFSKFQMIALSPITQSAALHLLYNHPVQRKAFPTAWENISQAMSYTWILFMSLIIQSERKVKEQFVFNKLMLA